jgi:hypothetical protein
MRSSIRRGAPAIALGLIASLHSSTFAQDSLRVRLLGEVHHFVERGCDVAMAESHAYIASGTASGLRVVDLSDPGTLAEVGHAIHDAPCTGVEMWSADLVRVVGDQAHVLYYAGNVSAESYRLCVYDVSEPSRPRELGFVDLPDKCTAEFATADRVYVTAADWQGFCGVKIIDVSDPAHPFKIGAIESPGYPEDVYVVGNLVYVADTSALKVYDVTTPGSPTEVGSYTPSGGSALIHRVAVQGHNVYLVDSAFGIRVLDASDLSSIHQVGACPHHQTDAYFSRLVISGDRAHYMQRGTISANDLVVLDISDPAAPNEIGRHAMPGEWWPLGFDQRAGHACVAASYHGVRLMDVSSPGSIEEIGHYDPYGLNLGVAESAGYAFVSTQDDGDNLLVYDVSDPSSPLVLQSLTFGGRPKWISARDHLLYVPGVEIGIVSGVTVLDISVPTQPTEVAHWSTPAGVLGVPLSVEFHGEYALVAMAYGGVQIYDVSQIGQPVALGHWTLWDPITNPDFGVRNVKAAWPYLFVPDQEHGLYVLDASDPNGIVEVASHATTGDAWWLDLSVDGEHLYLADHDGGLRILDVSDPLSPIEVGHVHENLLAADFVVAAGDSVYVGDGRGYGLHVYDVSDPTAPAEVAFHRTPGAKATAIALAGDLIYLADCTHLEVFELLDEPSSVPGPQPSMPAASGRIRSIRPNPFNATTTIVFELADAGRVSLSVFDVSGRSVRTIVDGLRGAGRHVEVVHLEGQASGIYYLRLETNGRSHSRTMALVK